MVVVPMGFLLLVYGIIVAFVIWDYTSDRKPTVLEYRVHAAHVYGHVMTISPDDALKPDVRAAAVPDVKIFTTGHYDSAATETDQNGLYSFELWINTSLEITVYAWKEGYTKRLELDKTWGYYGPVRVRVAPGEETQADIFIDLVAWGIE